MSLKLIKYQVRNLICLKMSKYKEESYQVRSHRKAIERDLGFKIMMKTSWLFKTEIDKT